MMDHISELAIVRDSLAKRKLGISYAIAEEGKYLEKNGFVPNHIPDADLPKFDTSRIAAFYLLVQIAEADINRPIPEVLRQYETWTVLANKVLTHHDQNNL